VPVRTSLINCVRGWSRTQLLKLPSGSTIPFPVESATLRSRSQMGFQYVERLLIVMDSLNEQLKLAYQELEQLAESDPVQATNVGARCRASHEHALRSGDR